MFFNTTWSIEKEIINTLKNDYKIKRVRVFITKPEPYKIIITIGLLKPISFYKEMMIVRRLDTKWDVLLPPLTEYRTTFKVLTPAEFLLNMEIE